MTFSKGTVQSPEVLRRKLIGNTGAQNIGTSGGVTLETKLANVDASVALKIQSVKISDFADIGAAYAFGVARGIRVDLEGLDVDCNSVTVTDDYYRIFFNGYFEISNILYPVNVWTYEKRTLCTETVGGDPYYAELQYSAWPQGKVWKRTKNGVRKVLFNRGESHIAQGLHVWSVNIGQGETVYEPLVNSPKKVGLTGGVTCWSAGTDGTREYFITRERGPNYTIGTTAHILNYRTFGSATVEGFVRKTIPLNDGTEVPVLFHSFTQLGDGKLAFGCHYNSGQVGIAKTDSDSTVGDSWTFAEMKPSGSYVEPSIFHDTDLNATVGFLRTQSVGVKPQFWVSLDNCATFTFTDLNDIPSSEFVFSPINLHKANGKYYAFLGGRTGACRQYLLVADAADAVANGASAFKKYYVGQSRYTGVGGSGANAGDIWADTDGVTLYYGEHQSGERDHLVAIKSLLIKFSQTTDKPLGPFSATGHQVQPYTEIIEVAAANLGTGWAADDSGEGVAVNGGGLTIRIRENKMRITGALKCTDATQTIYNLPYRFEPYSSSKHMAVHDDNNFAVLFLRGMQSSGTVGELKLLNKSGPLTKVNFDFEVDLLK